MMKVRIEYKNRRMETVGFDEFEFDMYCQKLSQDLTGLLSDIETFFDNQKIDVIEADEYYKKVRHRVFDIAGAIKRLPVNITFEEDHEDKHEIEPKKKATLSNILNLFNKEE